MNTKLLISFLKIKRVSTVKNDGTLSYETVYINYSFVRNIIINEEMTNILYELEPNSVVLYKISIDNGEYLPLQEKIDGVIVIRCYVSDKDYRKIKSVIDDVTW